MDNMLTWDEVALLLGIPLERMQGLLKKANVVPTQRDGKTWISRDDLRILYAQTYKNTDTPMSQAENTTFWDQRAKETNAEDLVTHRDLNQKKIELHMIEPHLSGDMNMLEVGCGNGYVTQFLCERVGLVHGFDASVEMIRKAENNVTAMNRALFVDQLPEPSSGQYLEQYDAAISVRVLINLENEEAQELAINWIWEKLKPGGLFLFLEGFQEGFQKINKTRVDLGMRPIKMPSYNTNFEVGRFEKAIQDRFDIVSTQKTGLYDFLARVYFPLMVGEDNVTYNTDYHLNARRCSMALSEERFMDEYSRLNFYLLKKIE